MKATGNPLYSSYIVNIVLNAVSSYSAIMLNIVTIHALRKTPSLPKTLKTLLLSLAVSDLGVGLLAQPLYVTYETMTLQQNTAFLSIVKAYVFIALTFIHTSFLTVVAISVDRFLAIHLHLRYQELVTHHRVVAVVISIWGLSIFIPVMYFWISAEIAVVAIDVILGLCFICTAIIYCNIYFNVRRHAIQIHSLQVHQQQEENANFARQRKSAASTFYVYLVFLICCLPEYCMGLIMPPISRSIVFTDLLLYCKTLLRINSSLNPIIYCWKMRHIRQTVMNTLRSILPSRQN